MKVNFVGKSKEEFEERKVELLTYLLITGKARGKIKQQFCGELLNFNFIWK